MPESYPVPYTSEEVLPDPNANAVVADSIQESSGPTTLAVGAVADGEFLTRDGNSIVGNAGGGGVTNSAGENVVPKSDGTNLVASRIIDGVVGLEPYIQIGGAAASADAAIRVYPNGATSYIDIDAPNAAIDMGDVSGTGGGLHLILVDGSPNSIAATTDSFHVQGADGFIDFNLDDAGKAAALSVTGSGNTGITLSTNFEGPINLTSNGPVSLGDVTDGGNSTKAIINDATQMIDLNANNGVNIGSVAKLVPITFASLPASPSEGMMAWVNDSNTATWGATIAGGGANKVLAIFDGSVWKVH